MIAWCRWIILSFFFVHCHRDLWSAFSAKSPDGRSVWRHATRDGEVRQIGSKCYGGLSGVLFRRCGPMIGSNVVIVSSGNVVSRACRSFTHTHTHTNIHTRVTPSSASFQNVVSSSRLLFEHIFLFRRATVS